MTAAVGGACVSRGDGAAVWRASTRPRRAVLCAVLCSMYNGIGLRTVRGTATNGYVQKNLSYVRPNMVRAKTGKSGEDWGSAAPKQRKACAEIEEHDRRRQVEVKALELRETLEEKG